MSFLECFLELPTYTTSCAHLISFLPSSYGSDNQVDTGVTWQNLASATPPISHFLSYGFSTVDVEGSLEKPLALEGLQIWKFKKVNNLRGNPWPMEDGNWWLSPSIPWANNSKVHSMQQDWALVAHSSDSLVLAVPPSLFHFSWFSISKIKHFTFQNKPSTPKSLTLALLSGGTQATTTTCN